MSISSTLEGIIEARNDIRAKMVAAGQATGDEQLRDLADNLNVTGGSSTLSGDLDVTETVGGITAGTEYTSGTSLENIFRDMLSPVKFPVLTNPSVSISATGVKLLEVGDTLNTLVSASFNRGSINPAYGTSGYRSGPAISYSLNGGLEQSGNTFNQTISEDNKTLHVTVRYEGGEQPKNSSGGNYSAPLPNGSVDSNVINYEFVNALYANTSDITTITKQSLVSKSVKVKEFNFPAQTVANPEVFDVPASWTITAVEVLNTLSNQWENAAGEFDIIDTAHDDAAGNQVIYKRYTDNRGYSAGARKIRIKWN